MREVYDIVHVLAIRFWETYDKETSSFDLSSFDFFHTLPDSLHGDALVHDFKHPIAAGFYAEVNQTAACPLHLVEQIIIHQIEARLAAPGKVVILLDHVFAEFHDLLAQDGEFQVHEIGIAYPKILDTVFNFLDQLIHALSTQTSTIGL